MKNNLVLILTFSTAISLCASGSYSAALKPRLVVLTDIAPHSVEPDDHEALIRLLVHADLFEIEALIATTGWNTGDYPAGWMDSIRVTVNAYEKDLPNLLKRSGQTGFAADESKQESGYWPSVAYLRSRTMLGSKKMGYSVLGDNNNSAGSDLIIKLADENDDRPVWISVWGGGNTVAQAIWRVQKERTPEQLKTFLRKIRVYTITDQDKPWGSTVAFSISSHQWMRREFTKDLMFIWDECAWLYQNSTGVSRWAEYAADIQGHGNLGAMYPKYRWGVEGDNPSFLYVMPPGLSNPDVPEQGSWGGYFEYQKGPDNVTFAYANQQGTDANTTCTDYVTAFYGANFNNFAARMDWAKSGAGNRNPVAVVNGDSSFSIITVKPLQGTSVALAASASHDPDNNTLTYRWWTMPAAGTWTQPVAIATPAANRVTVNVPAASAGKTFHIICEVTDNGTPPLTAYRRVIVEPVDAVVGVARGSQPLTVRTVTQKDVDCYDLRGRRVDIGRSGLPAGAGMVLRRIAVNRMAPQLLMVSP
jgi:hypothetical protein